MDFQHELNKAGGFTNIALLAKQVVEGFISGIHKSPFHGFSAEFAEHKIYNSGESTRHIDWKLYAKTDKLYSKRYEEETNLRCHLILDNSTSMHYPAIANYAIGSLNKIAFATLAAASIMTMLKKQRDAVGLSIYSDTYEYYAPEKGSERHYQMLYNTLNTSLQKDPGQRNTDTFTYLHQIAENIHRRSLIFLFSDMLQPASEPERLFEALRHLKYNKHEVILFHTFDRHKEIDFDFANTPTRFEDIETGAHINLYADTIRETYKKEVSDYFALLKSKCIQYQIKYVAADTSGDFSRILTTFMVERQKFV